MINTESPCKHSILYPTHKLNQMISDLIQDTGVTKEKNTFLKNVRLIKKMDPYPAYLIAANWREMTKSFLFTSLAGIGLFSETLNLEESPKENLLKVLQTSVIVISDDLNNVFNDFKKIAPKGAEGIHYLWWEKSILNPLKIACANQTSDLIIFASTNALTKTMQDLSKDYLGMAVQLRIVEEIALDIVLAFKYLFDIVHVNGKKLFPDRKNLAWIYSHITAEVVHHRLVQNEEAGMTLAAQTLEEQEKMLEYAKLYIRLWSDVFDDFAAIIKPYY